MTDTPDSAASGSSEASGDAGQAGSPGPGGPAGPGGAYGQNPYGQNPYGQGQGSYEQGPYGYGQTPYGGSPYGQGPYGSQYGQAPYGSQYGQAPYGSQYGQAPYGSPYGQWVPPAPKPGIIPLRPLSVGEILDGAFTALRRNPKATLGVAAIIMTLYGVINAAATLTLTHLVKNVTITGSGNTVTTAQVRHFAEVGLPLYGITLVVTFFADALLTGMLTAVVGHAVLGRQISIGEAWRIARPRFWTLIGSTLLNGLVILGTLVAGGVAVVAGAALVAAHVTAVGVLLIVIGIAVALFFIVFFWVRLALAAPAVVLEWQGPGSSLSRSWRLTRKSSWRVFGILVLTEVIVLIATGVLEVPFGVIGAIVGHGSGGTFIFGGTGTSSTSPSVAAVLIGAVGGIVAGSVTRPVLAGARALLYMDLRMRREGLDLVLQSATTEQFSSLWGPSTSSVPTGTTSPPTRPDVAGPPNVARPQDVTGPQDVAGPPDVTGPQDPQRW